MNKRADTNSEMPRKRRRLSMDSNPRPPTWPPAQVPVEIFDEITTYLSRSDVKNLRLVNHEFDRMVSAKYFRNVVVPFRSEMYKARKAVQEDNNLPTQPSTDTLFSSGMRIFQSFGDHILRFALSLELDEESLAYPPIKPTQKAVTSYWGIYRWPHESYHRYTELEGLEQTADETASMKEAMGYLSKVQELGLCCDAGRGYLLGPDQQLESPPLPHPVFGLRNLRYRLLQQRMGRAESASMNARKLAFESPRDFKYTVLESMVRNAGYTQGQAKDAISMLLSTENVSLMNIDFDERNTAAMEPGSYGHTFNGQTQAVNVNNVNNNVNNNINNIIANANANPNADPNANPPSDDGDAEDNMQRAAAVALSETTSAHPLQPKNLTRAQKEMLLELEWAHRALIQSYVLALIDNARTNSFSSLTTLTIAKIPSSHIHLFKREDFWQSLPNLTNVALAVVADWRHVAKVAPGCVEDHYVSPVDAVVKVHGLLQDQIAKQPNITFLHFEWICGGEFAPGLTQRNTYVLPAPFCTPTHMLAHDTALEPGRLLSLPHIKHLSLKNCYSTPHVFLQVIRTMGEQSLERLELETVSLTGPPSRRQGPIAAFMQGHAAAHLPLQPLIAHQAVQQLQLHGLAQGQVNAGVPQPPPLPPAPNANAQPPALPHIQPGMAAGQAFNVLANAQVQPVPDPAQADFEIGGLRLRRPDLLTWAGIIERLAPAPTIADLTSAQDVDDASIDDETNTDEGHRFVPRQHGKTNLSIESLSFKSCGYVCLDMPSIDNLSILPTRPPWQESQETTMRRRELSSFMQVCHDRQAARITNFLTAQEQYNLTTAYGMDIEWTNIYDEEVIEAAKRDGVMRPGKGRFSGNITKTVC